jgi:hypothetical protein
MNRTELQRFFTSAAKQKNFRTQAKRYWKSGRSLVRLVEIQSSRWTQGAYVNYGFMPLVFMKDTAPPSSSFWGYSIRGESECTPDSIRDIFIRITQDSIDTITPNEALTAINQLLDTVERDFSDEDAVRASILARDNLLVRDSYVTIWIRDWAQGKLREFKDYFPNK